MSPSRPTLSVLLQLPLKFGREDLETVEGLLNVNYNYHNTIMISDFLLTISSLVYFLSISVFYFYLKPNIENNNDVCIEYDD